MKVIVRNNNKHGFLYRWIHGELTNKELKEFLNSDNYRNLVLSRRATNI